MIKDLEKRAGDSQRQALQTPAGILKSSHGKWEQSRHNTNLQA